MDTLLETNLRGQLRDRRQRLESVISEVGDAADLVRLLQEVDAALDRLEKKSYGLCNVCNLAIEEEFLLANPLVQYCLCELSPEQQRALEDDLGLASRVQWALLPPQNVSFAGWEVHFRYAPAGPVSGDYCDAVTGESDGGELFLAVGDVSGKGVAASLFMARLNALFRALIQTEVSVQQLVERANSLLSESRLPSQYATLAGALARADGVIEICNAGHCPPLLLRQGKVAPVESGGFPLGLFKHEPYEVQQFQLSPGDLLFFYTDGLSEARNRSGAEYGTERICNLLHRGSALRPQALGASCLQDLQAFLSGAPRTDDMTLMIVRRAPDSL